MIRLGIVDFDTSHAVEFTRRFNHVGVAADQYVEGARVVLGYPGDSEMSPERIPEFTRQVAECGVELVDDPSEMIGKIDAVLIHSLCGAPHLERVRPFLSASIPAFVDKPFACSTDDAAEMINLSAEKNVTLFSSSALRYAPEIEQVTASSSPAGAIHGVLTYGPAKRAAGNPGLFHYGVHPTEMLFTLMGSGCQQVTTTYTDDAEVCTGEWNDGRIATLRGLRTGSTAYGFVAFCETGVVSQTVSTRYVYRNLCQAIVDGFVTGKAPIAIEETYDIVRFIAAAFESEESGGRTVSLDSIAPKISEL